LNTPFFIAKRLIKKESTDKELSRPIVRIATIGIALGIAVMIIAIGIVTGFQGEIRGKVIGFGSHIQISSLKGSENFADPKLEIKQDFYPSLDTEEHVSHINLYALKEGVIETPYNIQGIIAKGVADDYDWTFLREKLIEGRVLQIPSENGRELMLSKYLAGRLQLELGDKIPIYFQNARDDLSQRNFTIVGIYETGLRELDEEFVFINMDVIRQINQWGLNAQLIYEDCKNGETSISARGRGGDGRIKLNWSADSLKGEGPHQFCLNSDTVIYVVANDKSETLADTAFFTFSSPKGKTADCQCPGESEIEIHTTGGSAKYYTGGFEVQLESYDDLDRMDHIIYNYLNYDLKTTTIKQHLPEIFNWLEMLDLNTIIIVVLMIFISIINMTSALLILIMERTNMIGMLKALGASSWFVQRIFLTQAAYIIAIGLVFGNLIGIGLCLVQQHFELLTLNPENYYVSVVPVLVSPATILILNAGTLLICLAALLIPSLAVAQIRPSKAIRFD
jgi:lipoprotein-releasing system permease protein